MRRLESLLIGGCLALGVAASPCEAQAQAQAKDAAAVSQLYDEATREMEAGAYATACPKLERAFALDAQAYGVLAKLAQCYEAASKLASAFGAYTRLRSALLSSTDPRLDRTRATAETKLAELAPRLAKLTVALPAELRAMNGLRVLRDGVELSAAELGAPFPIDAGTHELTVELAGHEDWKKTLTVTDAELQEVAVEIGAKRVADQVSAPAKPAFWSTGRIAGFVVAGAGLALTGASIGVGVRAISLDDQSNAPGHCDRDTDICADPADRELRDDAVVAAHVSTALFVAGLAAVGGGVTLFLLAPSDAPERVTLSVRPGGLTLEGAFR